MSNPFKMGAHYATTNVRGDAEKGKNNTNKSSKDPCREIEERVLKGYWHTRQKKRSILTNFRSQWGGKVGTSKHTRQKVRVH